MQAKALRLFLGAVKTTPIAAIQVESSELPLDLRREKLAMAYWINLQGQREDRPAREVLKESWETVNKPGKGFAWKIKSLIKEAGIESNKFASVIVTPPIAPWLLEQPEVDLNIHKEIKGMGEGINLKAYVKEYIKSMHYSFLQIYTDGSKNIEPGRTGAAFFIPEFQVRKAGRITDGTSVYAEMVAILMALIIKKKKKVMYCQVW